MAIINFHKTYPFLSNFYYSDIFLDNRTWITAEHVYQSAKCANKEDKNKIMNAKTPGQSKRLGRKCEPRGDWEDIKFRVMSRVVKEKFDQNKDIAKKLLDTWPHILVEGNTWGDRIWGCTWNEYSQEWVGDNMLGRILMSVRMDLQIKCGDALFQIPDLLSLMDENKDLKIVKMA